MDPSAAKIATLVQETQTRALDLGDVRFRTDSLALPFRGSTVFGRQGTRFSWSFVDSDPAGVTVFAQDVSTNPENGPVFSWPEHGATVNATYPGQSYQAYVPCDPSGAAIDDGVVMTLQNLRSNETFTLSGMEPPIGSNITLSSHNIYVNANGVAWGRGFSGTVFFDSGWRANFNKGIFADGSIGRETVGGGMGFIPPPSRMISIANATFTSAANRTLDFDITTVNTTLQGWGVQVEKDNQIVKTLGSTTDPRGPGTGTGTNPVHVSLNWDGLDNNNQPVTGNITWVTTANTTTFVPGGNLNDGVNSVQARYADSLDSDELTVTEVKADQAQAFLDADDRPVPEPNIYFSDSPQISHPLFLAGTISTGTTTSISAKAASGLVKEITVVLVRQTSSTPESFRTRIVNPATGAKVSDEVTLQFDAGVTRASVTLPVQLGSVVHKYPYLKIQTSKNGGPWKSTKQKTDQPVYFSPFGQAQMPFSDKQPLGDQASKLAWELAEGSQTQEAVRNNVCGKLGNWLPSHHFVYTPGKYHYYLSGATQTFDFRTFMAHSGDQTQNNAFYGDCHDVASTVVTCCAAVGVEQGLFAFTPGPLPKGDAMSTYPMLVFAEATSDAPPDYEIQGTDPPAQKVWSFKEHESTTWDLKIWDSLGLVVVPPQNQYARLLGLTINQYLDILLLPRQGFDGGADVTVVPHDWIKAKGPDPRTGESPIRLTQIEQ